MHVSQFPFVDQGWSSSGWKVFAYEYFMQQMCRVSLPWKHVPRNDAHRVTVVLGK